MNILLLCVLVCGWTNAHLEDTLDYPRAEEVLDQGIRNYATAMCLRCVDKGLEYISTPEYPNLCIGQPKDYFYRKLDFAFIYSCKRSTCMEILTKRFTSLMSIRNCIEKTAVIPRHYRAQGYRYNWWYQPQFDYDY